MPSTYPKGLLSFLYQVTYNEYVRDAFHANPSGVMWNFGLSPAVQDLFQQSGKRADQDTPQIQQQRRELVAQLVQHLAADILKKHHKIIW